MTMILTGEYILLVVLFIFAIVLSKVFTGEYDFKFVLLFFAILLIPCIIFNYVGIYMIGFAILALALSIYLTIGSLK